MNYEIRYHPAVHDDLDAFPANIQDRLRHAMEARLGSAPHQYGERLTRDLLGLWKLRVGDYRVVFAIDLRGKGVIVWGVRHRKEIYPVMVKRWRRGRIPG